MKRLLSILLACFIITLLVFSGCTTSEEPTTSSSASTQSQTKQKASDIITLNFAEQDPGGGWGPVNAWQPMLKGIEEASGNRVKFNYYPAQTLVKGTDAWTALKGGVTDVAWCFHGYWAGMTPLADVITLPFLPIPSAEAGSATLWQLYEEFPSLAKPFQENHVQLLFTSEPYMLITTKKQVKILDDIKGLKLRATGGPPTDTIKALGGVPMLIPMPDCYEALQKGVIDGMAAPWEAVEDNRLMEAVQYYTYVPLFSVYFSISWNKNTWDSLPPDIQKIITENYGGIKGSMYGGRQMFDTAVQMGPELVRKEGLPIIEYTPPAEEIEKWRATAKPIWDQWVDKMESAGHSDAQKILDRTLQLLDQYKK